MAAKAGGLSRDVAMATRNCATTLKRRSQGDPMRAYDALPAELRQWLAAAILPWSAQSVRRVWCQALKSAQGDRSAAQAALSDIERRRLIRDVARIWGTGHPFLTEQRHASPLEGRTDDRG